MNTFAVKWVGLQYFLENLKIGHVFEYLFFLTFWYYLVHVCFTVVLSSFITLLHFMFDKKFCKF